MTFLRPGHRLPLATSRVVFEAAGPDAVDVSALLLSDDRRAAAPDDFIFYNARAGVGARLTEDGTGVELDLDALRPDVTAILCLVSHPDDHLPGRHPLRPTRATLRDADGAPLCTADATGTGISSALICFELYRRGPMWRVRALGHGFDGGLAELIGAHGVRVADDGPPPAPPVSRPGDGQPLVTPLDRNRPAERLWMILEDAARSAAALESTRLYVSRRLDADLSAAAADAASRHGASADRARRQARQRHNDVLGQAQERFSADSTQLETELATISHDLPPALAPWTSAAWSTGAGPGAVTDGMRVGDLRAPSRGELVVPWIIPSPMRRPLWIDTASSAAARDITSAVVLRVLAAITPRPLLDVIDLTGSLDRLTTRTATFMPDGIIREHSQIAPRLAAIVDTIELTRLTRQRGMADLAPRERVVVLTDFPHGFSTDDIDLVAVIASQGSGAGGSLVLVGGDESTSSDQQVAALSRFSDHLPAAGGTSFLDPWAGTDWELTADAVPADDRVLDRIVELLR